MKRQNSDVGGVFTFIACNNGTKRTTRIALLGTKSFRFPVTKSPKSLFFQLITSPLISVE